MTHQFHGEVAPPRGGNPPMGVHIPQSPPTASLKFYSAPKGVINLFTVIAVCFTLVNICLGYLLIIELVRDFY